MVNSIFPPNHDVAVVTNDETYLTHDVTKTGWELRILPPPLPPLNAPEVSSKMKFISHIKFPKKVLLWLASSEKRMFFRTELAVNGKRYSMKRLPEVASFIQKYDKGEDVVYWLNARTKRAMDIQTKSQQ